MASKMAEIGMPLM